MVKNKRGLIIALLMLVLFSSIYLLLKFRNQVDDTETSAATKTVFQMDADQIAELKIEYNKNIYTFIHENDTWSYKEDSQFPLNEAFMLNLVSKVTLIEATRELGEPENISEYGLDEPEIQVSVKDSDGKETILEFGDTNDAVSGCYLKTGNHVYLVDSGIKQAFSIDIRDLAELEEIPTVTSAIIQSVEIIQEGVTKVLNKDDSSETGWSLTTIRDGIEKSSMDADSSKVSTFMSNYTVLSWQNYVSYDKNNLEKYGLDHPTVVTVDYQVTETKEIENAEDESETQSKETEEIVVEKQETFYIGNQDENGNYYAMLKDGKNIYTLSSETIEKMTALEQEKFLSPLVADYSFADLDKVTFVRNNEKYIAEKKDVKKSSSEEGNEETEQKYYINEKEIEQELFQNVYSKINSMEWQSVEVKGETEKNPEMSILFEKEGGIHVTVNYYPYDSNFYLVENSKGNRMLVNKMKVKDMISSFDSMIDEWEK